MNGSSGVESPAAAAEPFWAEAGYVFFQSRVFIWLFPLVMLVGVWGNASCALVLLRNPDCFPFSVRLSMLVSCWFDFLLTAGKSVTHHLAPSVMGHILGVEDYRRQTSIEVCIVYYLFTIWLLHGSPFIRLGLCFHSLCATLAPLKSGTLLRKRNIILYQLLLIALGLLPCAKVFSASWNFERNRCYFQKDSIDQFYRTYTFFIGRVAVFLLLLITLAVIVVHLNRNGKDLGANRPDQTVTVSKIFITTSLIFFICEAPYTILSYLESNDSVLIITDNAEKQAKVLLNALMYFNPALNWVPYLIGRKFRRFYRNNFLSRKLFNKSKPSPTSQSMPSTG